MALTDLKRFTMLLFLMAGLYISVFINNLAIFIAEAFCFGAWSTLRALPTIRRQYYDDGK